MVWPFYHLVWCSVMTGCSKNLNRKYYLSSVTTKSVSRVSNQITLNQPAQSQKQVAQWATMLTLERLYKARKNGNINFSDV